MDHWKRDSPTLNHYFESMRLGANFLGGRRFGWVLQKGISANHTAADAAVVLAATCSTLATPPRRRRPHSSLAVFVAVAVAVAVADAVGGV